MSIEFGSGFKEADEYAFELCTSVKNDIKIPESTQTLKKERFLTVRVSRRYICPREILQ